MIFKFFQLSLLLIECAKFCGSRDIVGLVGPRAIKPPCLHGSLIFFRGYFVGPNFFLVGISGVRIFSRGYFRGSKAFSCGCFVGTSWIYTAQKIKFSIENFFSKFDQMRRKLRITSHLLKKPLLEKLYFLCSAISEEWEINAVILPQ